MLSNGHSSSSSFQAYKAAARAGHIHILEWMLVHFPVNETFMFDILIAAAEGGQLHVCQWAHARAPEPFQTVYIMESAATEGHLHVMNWALETLHENAPCRRALYIAAHHQQWAAAEWLLDNTNSIATRECMEELARHRRWRLYMHAIDMGADRYPDLVAVHVSSIEFLRKCVPRDWISSKAFVLASISHHRMHILEYLNEARVPIRAAWLTEAVFNDAGVYVVEV